MIAVAFSVTNRNPKTLANRLATRLGREPTNAELIEEVQRILREAREERE